MEVRRLKIALFDEIVDALNDTLERLATKEGLAAGELEIVA